MLIESLFAHARSSPDAVAVIDDHGSHTFKQMAGKAIGLSRYLAYQTQNSKVGILLPAGAGFVASFYATLLAGKSVVPINFLLGDKEVAHCIADSGVDTVITATPLRGKIQNASINVIDLLALPAAPDLSEIPPGTASTRCSDDLAVLMYTSGTSGLPKGVMLSYGNLQSDIDAAIELAQLKANHVFLGVIPLFHSFGMTAMMLAPIQLAATVIYIARFSPVAALSAIREHKVSLMFGVPSMFGAIARLKNATADDFKQVYAFISGGEPLPAAVRDAFKERFNVTLLEGYGLTETSPVISLNVPQAFKFGSVGTAVPGAIVRIMDEHDQPLGRNLQGEIWVKGPMVMQGYYNLPEESAQALTSDHFFKTGDLGHVDEEGYIFITGRKKDLIIVAGEKASPREIEEVIAKHPAVAEAAVVGKKDPSRGEVVVAFITLKPDQTATPDELRNFCRDGGLVNWKVPREVFLVEELPHSPTGKILKRVLAEMLASGKFGAATVNSAGEV